MHKLFITGLSLGLLWTLTSVNASTSFFDISRESLSYTNFSDGPSPQGFSSLSTPLTFARMDSGTTSLSNSISSTQLTLSSLTKTQKASLIKKLDELAAIIPEEKIEAHSQKDSCCFVFWKICFKISARTLGGLAIDIVLDLSAGKLDGQGPNGSIHHIVEIINATIEEVMNETHKK